MEQPASDRKKPSKDSFDTRTPQVEKWIGELPLANVGETSRRLYNVLVETNALEIPADQRFRMLELLREPLRSVEDALNRHFVGMKFPLPEKNRHIAELTRALFTETAVGYRQVVEDGGSKRGLLRDNKQAATASYRALTYLGLALLRTYQVYAPCPPGVWFAIHALYQRAEAQGFARNAIKENGEGHTIEDVYKRILLLALACPYRLRQGEAEQIFNMLGDWSGYAMLTPLTETSSASGLFVTNFASDDPPTYLVLRETQYNKDACRLLNASRLADIIRDTAARQRKAGNTGTRFPNERTLQRLMLAWGIMPKRRFSRSQKHSTAVVAMGLNASHYFISGEAAISDSGNDDLLFTSAAHFEAMETAEKQGTTPDLWELGGTRPLHETNPHAFGSQYMEFVQSKDKDPEPAAVLAVSAGYRTHEWKMVNVSAGGYRLLWDSSESSPAQVGELLGLREISEPDSFHLSLGVVRWMKTGEKQDLELGVEMLSPGAVAIGTRILKGRDEGEYTRSLLLPAIEAIRQPATLLTTALPYHVGDIVVVNSHGKEARVELTKMVENTGTFAQFQFRPLDSKSSTERLGQKPRTRTDFESLWAKI